MNKKSGFSLLELMIAVVIVGILATIAIPLYTEQVTKTRRADAKVAIMDLASRMERYFAENHTYATATIGANNATTDLLTSNASPEGYYQLSIVNQTASTFTLQAATVAGSAQAQNDTACASLRINQLGQKSITGTGNVQDCW